MYNKFLVAPNRVNYVYDVTRLDLVLTVGNAYASLNFIRMNGFTIIISYLMEQLNTTLPTLTLVSHPLIRNAALTPWMYSCL